MTSSPYEVDRFQAYDKTVKYQGVVDQNQLEMAGPPGSMWMPARQELAARSMQFPGSLAASTTVTGAAEQRFLD
jgi:hypothetical protein